MRVLTAADEWLIRVLARGGVPYRAAWRLWMDLTRRYEEKYRAYHGHTHVAEAFDTLWTLLPHKPSPEVVLALWFHDSVYDVTRTDNEVRSAELARQKLSQWSPPPADVDRVAALIMSTADHRPVDDTLESRALLDADLAILGAPRQEYDRYVEGIRREYSWMPIETLRHERAAWLRRLIARPHIYHTELMRERLEENARLNAAAELVQLENA